jgi:hypothetical protein
MSAPSAWPIRVTGTPGPDQDLPRPLPLDQFQKRPGWPAPEKITADGKGPLARKTVFSTLPPGRPVFRPSDGIPEETVGAPLCPPLTERPSFFLLCGNQIFHVWILWVPGHFGFFPILFRDFGRKDGRIVPQSSLTISFYILSSYVMKCHIMGGLKRFS